MYIGLIKAQILATVKYVRINKRLTHENRGKSVVFTIHPVISIFYAQPKKTSSDNTTLDATKTLSSKKSYKTFCEREYCPLV